MCESVIIFATRANGTIGIRPCLVHIDNFLIDGEAMAVGFLKKDKQSNKLRMSDYGFNLWKFLWYTICNIGAVLLGSIATLAIALIVYAINLQDLTSFDFSSAFHNVVYDWLYDDVFVAILTLGAVLVISYIVSFRRDSDEYFGAFSKVVDCLAVVCVLLCFLIIGLEIIYAWHMSHSNGGTIGNLLFYNIVEIASLLVCGFLQSFSHPEYYMSPPQNS